MTALLFLSLLQAAKSCPWISDATVDKIVGGQVTPKITRTSCEFTHEKDYLRIEVFAPGSAFRSYFKSCKSSPEPVKGIGNEAVVCDGEHSEQIGIGRVRDDVFVLRLKAPFSRDLVRAKVRAAAELVSGNLY